MKQKVKCGRHSQKNRLQIFKDTKVLYSVNIMCTVFTIQVAFLKYDPLLRV